MPAVLIFRETQTMSRLVLFAVIAFFAGTTALADVVDFTFQLDTGGTLSGATLTQSQVLNSGDGVSFTATLTVSGSGNLGRNSAGIGVDGNADDAINGSEFVSFSMALSGVTSGSVSFDGFDQIDFNSFDSGEFAAISPDSNYDNPGDVIINGGATTDDIYALPDLSTFFVVADGAIGTNFRIDDVRASFTTTAAVPEPSAVWLLALSGVTICFSRWKS